MDLEQITILLPCQDLEDLALNRGAADAEQLLAGWSALWHPKLLKTVRAMPSWSPAESPPEEPVRHLVLVPDCSLVLLPDDWLKEATAAGACVLQDWRSRDELLAMMTEQLGLSDQTAEELDSELIADFLALGFCHFQVEMITRQLRYMSNLDDDAFFSEVLAAVDEAFGGDLEAARERLRSAYELLNEAREYFHPVDAHLLDLTLVADTTLGELLRKELSAGTPLNLLICGKVLQQMAQQEPDTLKAVAAAVQNNTATIIGGEFLESPLPMLSPEAIKHNLQRGLTAYRELLDVRPTVFGRRRFGLTPVLPQILKQLGFNAALHFTLDDGRFPTDNQGRIQWEGIDGTTVDSFDRAPGDAAGADVFLRLPETLGNLMDLDNAATMVFAHWPGYASTWYQDLKRIAAYSSVLGAFATAENYFEETSTFGSQAQYRADQYRSPYLAQDVAAGRTDPISRWVRYYRRRAAAEAVQTLNTLSTIAACDQAACGLASLIAEVDDSISTDNESCDLDQRLSSALNNAMARFSGSLTGSASTTETGCLAANPLSFSRRMCVETPNPAVIDVPAMGFAWVGPEQSSDAPSETRRFRKNRPKDEPPLAEQLDNETVLRNEFFEIVVDPHTGALRSISDYYSRGARLAQQIALRSPQGKGVEPGDDANYSIMAADEVIATSSGPVLGEVVSRGRLVDCSAKRLAGFTQTTRVHRGSRIIELLIELDIDRLPEQNPWQSYYAARFAWADATANLYRGVNMANVPTDCSQMETPHFIDIRSGKVRTTLLCGGTAYHRRLGLRKLDTLLVVRGETARQFRLGIGVDVSHPVQAALDFIAPETVLHGVPCPTATSGWMFHIDARNVVATHIEPLFSSDNDNTFSRRRHDDDTFSRRRHDGVEGFVIRLLETDGRKVQVGLRSFRPIRSATKLHAGDTPPVELPVAGDRITIDLGPHEWAEVEALFD